MIGWDQSLGTERNAQPLKRRWGLGHMLILAVLATALGTYLIATTVLIAQDGAYYIRQAQDLVDPAVQPSTDTFMGYPWLVAWTWRLARACGIEQDRLSWIHAAQTTTLLCRVLAVLAFYQLGRILVGPRESLLAMTILVVLPEPAHMGSDALRDWPCSLLLGLGVLFLARGMASHRARWFAAGGLASGWGLFFHLASAQTVLFGTIWLLWRLMRPGVDKVRTRTQTTLALAVLWAAFLAGAGIVAARQGFVVPERFRPAEQAEAHMIDGQSATPQQPALHRSVRQAAFPGGRAVEALGMTAEALAENLMWFFVLPAVIGLIVRIRSDNRDMKSFLVCALLIVNVLLCVARYVMIDPAHVSRRYVLPLTIVVCFYVPCGLRTMAQWLVTRTRSKAVSAAADNRVCWILMIAGLSLCVPKLMRPIRIDKQGYRDAAEWIARNTDPGTVIAVFDQRIAMYTGREAVCYLVEPTHGQLRYHSLAKRSARLQSRLPAEVTLIVERVRPGRPRLNFRESLAEVASFPVRRNAEARMVVSRIQR